MQILRSIELLAPHSRVARVGRHPGVAADETTARKQNMKNMAASNSTTKQGRRWSKLDVHGPLGTACGEKTSSLTFARTACDEKVPGPPTMPTRRISHHAVAYEVAPRKNKKSSRGILKKSSLVDAVPHPNQRYSTEDGEADTVDIATGRRRSPMVTSGENEWPNCSLDKVTDDLTASLDQGHDKACPRPPVLARRR